jgi:hypothetical protein
VEVGSSNESKPAGFRRDLVRGHPVQVHDDVLGLTTIAGSHDLAAPADRGAASFLRDRDQLARVAHAQNLASFGRRW